MNEDSRIETEDASICWRAFSLYFLLRGPSRLAGVLMLLPRKAPELWTSPQRESLGPIGQTNKKLYVVWPVVL